MTTVHYTNIVISLAKEKNCFYQRLMKSTMTFNLLPTVLNNTPSITSQTPGGEYTRVGRGFVQALVPHGSGMLKLLLKSELNFEYQFYKLTADVYT